MLDDELGVRLVLVDGFDHPIAIEPDGALFIFLEAVGIGIAGGVEPVAAPTFAVVGRGEEAVDLLAVGVGALVGHEGVDFGRGGREANEVEGESPEEGSFVGRRRGTDAFLG